MGYNTAVLILNDELHTIENDPEFGKKLANAIREQSYPPEHRTLLRGAQVLSVHHADGVAVIGIGGNRGRILGWGQWNENDDGLLKSVKRWREWKKRQEKREGENAP